jgi:uncharacterized protein (DUF2141 family)
MNKIKITTLVFLCIFFSSFVSAQQNAVTVTISNLRSNKGHVLISLFKEGTGYPDSPEKAFRKEKLAITANKAQVIFSDLPAGNYAIAILHDENDDMKMNKTWVGLPKEGYGFSNNVMGTFGPPSYSKAKFNHATGQTTIQQIRARY